MSAASIKATTPITSEVQVRPGARAIAHSILSKVFILGLQAGTGILTARTLQPTGRGELAAMILWPLFMASITTLGLPSSLIYYLRRKPEERERLIANGLLMAAVLIFWPLMSRPWYSFASSHGHGFCWERFRQPLDSLSGGTSNTTALSTLENR
jgi:hypothetical protein